MLAQYMATGLTYAELGEINGMTYQRVGQMIRHARADAGIKKKKTKKKKCY